MIIDIDYKELLKSKEPEKIKKVHKTELRLIPALEDRIPIYPVSMNEVPVTINNVEVSIQGYQYSVLKSILEFRPINEYENKVKNAMIIDIANTITEKVWSIRKQKGFYKTIQDVIMKKFEYCEVLEYGDIEQ